MKEAKAMTYSCYQMYARQPTGLSPEFVEYPGLTEPVPGRRVSHAAQPALHILVVQCPEAVVWRCSFCRACKVAHNRLCLRKSHVEAALLPPERACLYLALRDLCGCRTLAMHQATYYALRPEVIESLFYLHQITGNPVYREWGWRIFTSIET